MDINKQDPRPLWDILTCCASLRCVLERFIASLDLVDSSTDTCGKKTIPQPLQSWTILQYSKRFVTHPRRENWWFHPSPLTFARNDSSELDDSLEARLKLVIGHLVVQVSFRISFRIIPDCSIVRRFCNLKNLGSQYV
ncbi:hypothetical protein E6O75_ATG02401 [Venturia nashicola]|uniref:Uncharacterized protein n=1 Tax=Venturia nashicola TaxID=86259 RepID=A0A4Z1PFC3_9PEZI|nr:hypothetical protein E6O75_ATG02401 [Venturia nashicola]